MTKEAAKYFFEATEKEAIKCKLYNIKRKQTKILVFWRFLTFDVSYYNWAQNLRGIDEGRPAYVKKHKFYYQKNRIWLVDWIIIQNLSCSFVMEETTRKYTNLQTICVNTLKIHKLCEVLGKKITLPIPEKFGLAFDGWTETTLHFIAIFAIVPF